MEKLFPYVDNDGEECLIAVGEGVERPVGVEVPVVTSHLDPEEFARRKDAGAGLAQLLHKAPKSEDELVRAAKPAVDAAVVSLKELGRPVEDQLPRVAKAA